jgi:hypothetical protein
VIRLLLWQVARDIQTRCQIMRLEEISIRCPASDKKAKRPHQLINYTMDSSGFGVSRNEFDEKDRVFFTLVICAKEKSRSQLAIDTILNLNKLLGECEFPYTVMLFDNHSTITQYKEFVPKNWITYNSRENLGYWGALYWILNRTLDDRDDSFIYIVESDIEHKTLKPLNEVVLFLKEYKKINSVRTQNFRLKYKWFYDKDKKWLPFHITESEINLRNAITKEKAYFMKNPEFSQIYISNLHAKLPAMHRISSLRNCFNHLEEKREFSEMDFFKFMNELSPQIGVLSPGIFKTLSTRRNSETVAGSSYLTHNPLFSELYIPSRTGTLNRKKISETIVEKSDNG